MVFEKFGCLLQRVFLSFYFYRHGAGDLPVLLGHYAQLGLQRNICFPEEFDAFAHIAQVGKILLLIEIFGIRAIDEFAVEQICIGLQLWLNLQSDYDLQMAELEIGKALRKIEPVAAA